MKDCKFSITKLKVISWSWPCLARALDDICNKVDGVYPTYDSSGELYSVSIELSLYMESKQKYEQDYNEHLANLKAMLKTCDEIDPIDRRNLFELIRWINDNENDTDCLEIIT